MAQQTLQTIKNWFVRGAKPTQNQFADTFDSFWHKSEAISQSNVQNLGTTLTQMQTDIDAAVKIADMSKFMGVSGIATQTSQMWCKLARVTINLPSDISTDYNQKCTLVGSIDVVSQPTNPYSYEDHYIQSARLQVKISWSHPRRSVEVELALKDAVSLTTDNFKVVEITHDSTNRNEELDIYVRTNYIYDRFFYFYKTNVQYCDDVISFTPYEAEAAVLTLPSGTGFSFSPTDGTEDKTLIVEFSNKTSVTITHTLNKYPSVTIVDSNGYQILADVLYSSRSSITVSFSQSMSGNIYLN